MKADILSDGNIIKQSLRKNRATLNSYHRGLNMPHTIFISHRSTDGEVADMLFDFLVGTGIPADAIFCSSRPGNDVREKVSVEVKERLQDSAVYMMILSEEYFKSAYCLNEAGIIWYRDEVTCIPIALPGIDDSSIKGFYGYDNKLRRLDNTADIADIYDLVRSKLDVPVAKPAAIASGAEKLKRRYQRYFQLSDGPVKGSFGPGQGANANMVMEDGGMDLRASVMLVCAIENRGEIVITKSLSGTYYSSGRFTYNSGQDARELAAWDGAVDALAAGGFIKRTEDKPVQYKVTSAGYAFGDRFKKARGIDTSQSPRQVLEMLEELREGAE